MNSRRFIQRVRTVAAGLPDRRTGDNRLFEMADFVLSAFAVFFTQCPSFLSFQRNMQQARGRNNARSLFQVERIPTDNHIRQMLDPVAPGRLISASLTISTKPLSKWACWRRCGVWATPASSPVDATQ